MLQGVEVFQEQEPGSLLGVVELAGTPGILPEDVVDVFEGLFEHGLSLNREDWPQWRSQDERRAGPLF